MAEEEEKIMIVEKWITLPQEILIEILSWLPAISLVSSFKLVCKAWCTLIHDPDFIKMHLLNRGGGGRERRISSNNNNHHSLICKSGYKFFQLYPPFNFEGIILPTEAPKKLDFDFHLSALSTSRRRLVGSCNGLLCLSSVVNDDDENIILLNPSTRRYKISALMQPIQCPQGFTRTGDTYGFGCCYNPTTNIDEYKVVRIVYFARYDHAAGFSYRSQPYVYCMSSNSWRTQTKIRDYAFSISSSQSGVFVNEALHWVATCCTNKLWGTIASFDVRDEEFGQLSIPLSCQPTADDDICQYFQLHEVILMNMKGCLSMILRAAHANDNRMDAAADLEIWVMKEYGIKELWTKEFVISSGDTDPPRPLSDLKLSWRCNAYVLKGDQMLIVGLANTKEGRRLSWEGYRKFVLYDINNRMTNGDFKMIGVPDEPYPRIDLVDNIETLVSLKSSIMAGVPL